MHFRPREGADIAYTGRKDVKERLEADNLSIGFGLQISFFNKRKCRPLFGAQYRLGVPLRLTYQFENTSFDPTFNLPLIFSAKGGAKFMHTRSTYTGLELDITSSSQLRFKVGVELVHHL